MVNGFGLRVLTFVVVEPRQIVEAGGHVGVLRAQGLFPDRQRPLVKGLGLRVLTLVVIEQRQIVEAGGITLVCLTAEPGFSRSPRYR